MLLPLGLVSCTPTATALKCTAAVSQARPVQNTVESVTVKTVAGAQVVTSARYKTNTANVTTLSNAHGVANTFYNVGTALTSFKVNVLVTVLKGAQHATCATSFIPAAPKGVPSTPPPPVSPKVLTGVLTSADWNDTNTPGRTISYVHEGYACYAAHPGDSQNPCGEWQPSVTVSGFNQFGGAPTDVYGPTIVSGSVDFKWSAKCLKGGFVYDGEQRKDFSGRYLTPRFLRSDDGDALTFLLDAIVPLTQHSDECAGDLVLLSESASDARFHFDGGSAYPVLDFSVRGPWS
jgi:hypothetical protein